MRIYKIEKEIFTIDELKSIHPKGYKEAINNPSTQVVEDVIEGIKHTVGEFEACLSDMGFNDVKIHWSGFGSQGSGASFVCENVDDEKLIDLIVNWKDEQTEDNLIYIGFFFKGQIKDVQKELDEDVVKSIRYLISIGYMKSKVYSCGRDVHEHSTKFSTPVYIDDLSNEKDVNIDELEKHILNYEQVMENFRYRLSSKIFSVIEEEYFGQLKEDELVQRYSEYDYEFTSDGKVHEE